MCRAEVICDASAAASPVVGGLIGTAFTAADPLLGIAGQIPVLNIFIGDGADGTAAHPDGGNAGMFLGNGGAGYTPTTVGATGGNGGNGGFLGNGGTGGTGGPGGFSSLGAAIAGGDGGDGGHGGFIGSGGNGGAGGNGATGAAGVNPTGAPNLVHGALASACRTAATVAHGKAAAMVESSVVMAATAAPFVGCRRDGPDGGDARAVGAKAAPLVTGGSSVAGNGGNGGDGGDGATGVTGGTGTRGGIGGVGGTGGVVGLGGTAARVASVVAVAPARPAVPVAEVATAAR